jgi:hypothetical protein
VPKTELNLFRLYALSNTNRWRWLWHTRCGNFKKTTKVAESLFDDRDHAFCIECANGDDMPWVRMEDGVVRVADVLHCD